MTRKILVFQDGESLLKFLRGHNINDIENIEFPVDCQVTMTAHFYGVWGGSPNRVASVLGSGLKK
jgi:hypothetical protein